MQACFHVGGKCWIQNIASENASYANLRWPYTLKFQILGKNLILNLSKYGLKNLLLFTFHSLHMLVIYKGYFINKWVHTVVLGVM